MRHLAHYAKRTKPLWVLGKVRFCWVSLWIVQARRNGGEGGIRTPDSLATMADFESAAFNRALPPLRRGKPLIANGFCGLLPSGLIIPKVCWAQNVRQPSSTPLILERRRIHQSHAECLSTSCRATIPVSPPLALLHITIPNRSILSRHGVRD